MRYQSKPYRSHSYLFRENYVNKDNKENKENNNSINLQPTKPHLNKKETLLPSYNLPKLEPQVSQSTNHSILSTFIKKDTLPDQLKRAYSQIIAKDYSEDIMNHLCSRSKHSKNFLAQHTITPSLRSKMVDWMIEVLCSYKMAEETFFRSVRMMDRFLQKCSEKQELKELHLIGVTSMFAASKYQQIHPLKLSIIYDKIARKKFKKSQIIQKQSEIISVLDFRLEEVTVYDLVRHISEQIKVCFTEPSCKYFQKVLLYLSKMVLFNHELAEENTTLLAASVFFIALKTLEQVDSTVEPEKKINNICRLLNVLEDEVLELSRKVLDLAKNFDRIYPNLSNLKKFNKFEYNCE